MFAQIDARLPQINLDEKPVVNSEELQHYVSGVRSNHALWGHQYWLWVWL